MVRAEFVKHRRSPRAEAVPSLTARPPAAGRADKEADIPVPAREIPADGLRVVPASVYHQYDFTGDGEVRELLRVLVHNGSDVVCLVVYGKNHGAQRVHRF